ncbi:MAG: DUF2783 domain-containing protein [Roseomonas sp.]|nr:DUF2783 domain-containing protein [Roseomonas sp.]
MVPHTRVAVLVSLIEWRNRAEARAQKGRCGVTGLVNKARFADPDAAYRAITEAHRDLTESQSADLNAALVLILANQLGDMAMLREALALARSTVVPSQKP